MTTQTIGTVRYIGNGLYVEVPDTTGFDYNDTDVRHVVMEWWNKNNPDNKVIINENKFGVDLVALNEYGTYQDLHQITFGIEIEHSKSWNDHEYRWETVRIPMRKAKYWMRKNTTIHYVTVNHDMTACWVLDDETIRHKFYHVRDTLHNGNKEDFLKYYNRKYQWHEIRPDTP